MSDSKADTIKPWIFDRHVARNFSKIAKSNIPDYERVIAQCIEIISKVGSENPRIIDVGCATGNTLRRLHHVGFTRLVGVDSSKPMLDTIDIPSAQLILSEDFPTHAGPYDVVLANWTLHFIKNRETYLEAIAASLSTNGILILTEKTQSSAIIQSLYRNFKYGNGLTEQEIQTKERQLNGVLITRPVNWYIALLSQLGFAEIEIINSRCGFVSFLAQKACR